MNKFNDDMSNFKFCVTLGENRNKTSTVRISWLS